MATAAPFTDRNLTKLSRPGLTHFQPDPSSPHTPQRTISSTISSPSVSYRAEEEAVIFELGTRHLSAGFAGEENPRCRLSFGPDESRRVGDFRQYMPEYEHRPSMRRRLDTWGDDHELWKMDLRGFDLGLMQDKVERAVREAYAKYLLLDCKARKVCLVVPSVLPHRLLDRVLHVLFENFQVPAITLVSPAVMATVAAGCRSGLVVKVGWRETIVTAVYEYREVRQARSVRAMKMVNKEMAKMLEGYGRDTKGHQWYGGVDAEEDQVSIDVDQAEEVTARMGWCNPRIPHSWTTPPDSATTASESPATPTQSLSEPAAREQSSHPNKSNLITIPSPHSHAKQLNIPFSSFTAPIEATLFPPSIRSTLDSHELPLASLIYRTLLALPPDVRSTLMSHLLFIGGGSHLSGLKPRLVNELSALVAERGFDPVSGEAADLRRKRLKDISANREAQKKTPEGCATLPASEQPQVKDTTDIKLERDRAKGRKPMFEGEVRALETLGVWAGASLVSSLRVKGVVDIERESFLQYGLAGAKKGQAPPAFADQRRSMAPDLGRLERFNWTLGAWA